GKAMFKAKLKASVLKTVIDATLPLVDEVKFHIAPEGVSLKTVDSAHVAMVDVSLGAKAFQEYKATDLELGVDLDKLREILKLGTGEEVIGLEYKEDQNRLVLTLGNLVRRMSPIDPSGIPDPKVPNLNLPNRVRVKASEISQGIKASESVSDHVALITDDGGFEIIAEGDTDVVNMKLTKNQLVELQAPERTKSLFSLDYFSKMIKAADGAGEVTLSLGSDYPVRMEFDFADGHGHVTYLLAPRIENE
ncbi:MAG: proliferating cell nuclear antigen (pcna), partial [bacterium]